MKNIGKCSFPECHCPSVLKRELPAITPEKAQREGDQPLPMPNNNPALWPIVMDDMQARHEVGIKRYGTPLQSWNGRDMLRDAYEEALDLAVYLRGALFERDGK